MRPARFLFAAIAVASLAGFRSEETYSLVPKWTKGSSSTYFFTMKFVTPEADFQLEGKSHIKVLDVFDDGGYELEESTSEAKMTSSGQDQAIPPSEPKAQKYDKRGKRLKKDSDGEPHGDMMTKVLTDVMDFLPDHNVKMGETWTRESEFGTIKSSLVGTEKIGGYDCLKITIDATLSKQETEGISHGTYYIRASDFGIVQGTCKLEKPKFGEDPSPGEMVFEIKRIEG